MIKLLHALVMVACVGMAHQASEVVLLVHLLMFTENYFTEFHYIPLLKVVKELVV